jgi:hypothetical protein
VDRGGALQPRLHWLSNGRRVVVYKDPRSGALKQAVVR